MHYCITCFFIAVCKIPDAGRLATREYSDETEERHEKQAASQPDIHISVNVNVNTQPLELSPRQPEIRSSTGFKIAMIGFAGFSQLLAKKWQDKGHKIVAWNRSPRPEVLDVAQTNFDMRIGCDIFFANWAKAVQAANDKAIPIDAECGTKEDGIDSHSLMFRKHGDISVVVVSLAIIHLTSLFEGPLAIDWGQVPPGTVFVDVSSVKGYPQDLFGKFIPSQFGLCLTHPMFGPMMAAKQDGSWKDFNVMYDPKVREAEPRSSAKSLSQAANMPAQLFSFSGEECHLMSMSCQDHDELAAQTQFIVHFFGNVITNIQNSTSLEFSHRLKELDELAKGVAKENEDLEKGLYVNLFVEQVLRTTIETLSQTFLCTDVNTAGQQKSAIELDLYATILLRALPDLRRVPDKIDTGNVKKLRRFQKEALDDGHLQLCRFHTDAYNDACKFLSKAIEQVNKKFGGKSKELLSKL